MAKAISYTNLNLEPYKNFYPPFQNKNGETMSAVSKAKDIHIQIGNLDEYWEFLEVIRGTYKGLHFKIRNTSIIKWFETFENMQIRNLCDLSTDWFGKTLPYEHVRRMLCTLLNSRGDIVLKCGKALQCYTMLNDDEIEPIDVADLEEGCAVIPVISFDGLFIAKHHFTPSFTVENLLVLQKKVGTPETTTFIRKENIDEEILDPHGIHSFENLNSGSYDSQDI